MISAPDPEELGGTSLESVFNGRVVVVIIKSASLSSADAILDPADSAVMLLARVYAPNGQVIYAENHSGQHTKRIGFSGTGKKEGKILATAARAAVDSLMSDRRFLEAIQ